MVSIPFNHEGVMSSFGKAVADVLRDVKKDFSIKEKLGEVPIDPQVREAVNADFDKMIERHDTVKPFPGIL